MGSTDDELTRHPSPKEVEEAKQSAVVAMGQLKRGEMSASTAAQIMKRHQDMETERNDAEQAHAANITVMDDYTRLNPTGSDWDSGSRRSGGAGDGSGGNIASMNPNSGYNGAGEGGGVGAGSDGGAGGGSAISASDIGTSTSSAPRLRHSYDAFSVEMKRISRCPSST